MSYNIGGGECSSPLPQQQQQQQYVSTSNGGNTLLLAPLPDGVIGLVRDGVVHQPQQTSLPLPEAIVQITQPLSRSALSEGGVTALMTRAGDVTVTPVTLRSQPITNPPPQPRHQQLHSVTLSRHSSNSPMLEDDIGAGDYITLTSNNSALVFNSISTSQSHDRGISCETIEPSTICKLSYFQKSPLSQ